MRVRRVVLQVAAPERDRHLGHAHRRAGWPELACCTASIASARMALAIKEYRQENARPCGATGRCEGFGFLGGTRGRARRQNRGARYAWRSDATNESSGVDGSGAPVLRGLHLTADLRGCAAGRAEMVDPALLRRRCLQAVADARPARRGRALPSLRR